MKRMMRLLAMAVLSTMLTICLGSHVALAEGAIVDSGVCGNVSWTLDSDGLLVIGSDGNGGVIQSPDELGTSYPDYYPWSYRDDVKSVVIRPGVKASADLSNLFCGCNSLESADLSNLDTSSVTSMFDLFGGTALTSLDLSTWDTSNVESMSFAFEGCRSLRTINLSGWTMTSVEDMPSMFSNCESLTELDVSNWDVSNVKSMMNMFENCKSLSELELRNWCPVSLTDVRGMFYGCSSITSLFLNDWILEKVTDMSDMFDNCKSLREVYLSNWNTSSVTDMYSMFYGCNALEELDISRWNTSSVTNMDYMFSGCSSLRELDMSGWDTSAVKGMDSMFSGCSSLKKIDMSGWNMQAVTSMEYMLSGCYPSEWSIGSNYNLQTDTVPMRSNTISEYDPENEYKWWSVKDQEWFSIEELVSQRAGIADTYTNGKDGIDPDTVEHYPRGYSFLDDSYSFGNFRTAISSHYFETLYERGAGKLFARRSLTKGVCYGMATTTGAILNGHPFAKEFTCDGVRASRIRDLALDTLTTDYGQNPESLGSSVYVNDNVGYMTLGSYIKYAHIAQYSVENCYEDYLIADWEGYDDTKAFLSYIKDSIDQDVEGITIGMRRKGAGHCVGVIGYVGNSIIIDDPNNPNRPEYLSIGKNGEWEFSGSGMYNSSQTEACLSYSPPVTAMRAWRVLSTGKKKLHGESAFYSTDSSANTDEYIDGMDRLCADSALVRVEADDYEIAEWNAIALPESTGDNELFDGGSVDTKGMYWIEGDSEVTVEDLVGDSCTVEIGADDTLVSSTVSGGSSVNTVVDGATSSTSIDSPKGCSVSVACTTMDEEYGPDETLTVSGVSSANDATIQGGSSTYVVSGFDGMTVKFEKAEKTTEAELEDAGGKGFVVQLQDAEEDPYIQVSEATIEDADIDVPEVCVYTGSYVEPLPTVSFMGIALTLGKDYEVSYANNQRIGIATVTVQGIGAYSGTVTREFRITCANLKKASIASIPSKTYTGKQIKPAPVIKYGSARLKSGVDYSVSYKNNTKVGTATVVIVGKGNYTGSVSKTFSIVPKGTKLSKLSAGKKSLTAEWKKQAVQTSGYQIQLSTSSSFKTGNKTVLVKGVKVTSRKIAKLKAKKTYYVRIRTYKKIGGKTYYSSWSAKKKIKTK